jgi:ubiquinone biosynthesis protein
MLQGVAKHLAPDYRLTDTVAAYAHSAVGGRLSPEQLLTGAHRTMARYKHLLDDLPVGLSRALRRASEGEFRVAVRPSGYDRLLDRLRDLVIPVCFTVLLAAFVVGSSVIVALRPGSTTAGVVGEAMLAIATVVAVLWMIALLLGYRRRRR